MTIADQINRLNNAKAAIKTSIENKGVSVSDSAKLDEYPALIDSIEVGSGGGGGDSTYVNPDFYEIRTQGGTDYSYLFSYTKLTTLDLSGWDVSNATNMNDMFGNCSELTTLDLSGWNLSSITDIQRFLYSCSSLTTLNINGWKSNSEKNMQALFYGCSKLTTLDLSTWDVSNATNISNMFRSCSTLTELNISGLDTSKTTNMDTLFYFDTKLKTIIGELDASNLTNGLGATSYLCAFYSCSSLETVYIKNIYKDIKITNNSQYGVNLGRTKVKDECLIYIINELPDLINDKGLTATDKIVFTLPPTNTLTAEQIQVAIDKGWSVANTTY